MKNRYNDELIAPQLKNCLPIASPVFVLFVLYTKDKGRRDLDNFTGVHKKFFMDCLVKNGIITEDHVFECPLSMEVFGGVDKTNPRVDMYVSSDLNQLGKTARKLLWNELP